MSRSNEKIGVTLALIPRPMTSAMAGRPALVAGIPIRMPGPPTGTLGMKPRGRDGSTVMRTPGLPGDSGNRVLQVQCVLVKHGYSVGSKGVDGDFGPGTKSAVLSFQSDKGSTPTAAWSTRPGPFCAASSDAAGPWPPLAQAWNRTGHTGRAAR